jgi:pyridoxamine 5'-phosphate oxidase
VGGLSEHSIHQDLPPEYSQKMINEYRETKTLLRGLSSLKGLFRPLHLACFS